MSVTPEDIEKVALLARLSIAESELPEVTERFSKVLDLVDELNTIDTDGVIPMSNPAQDSGYFLVPKVID
jgi:aspartyl-tRNA(Asn)/glutamyl-tRNA(Gln) amidotransferase subunit C